MSMKYLKLLVFQLAFLYQANCETCVIDEGNDDVVAGPILPAKATDSMFSLLATVHQLFQDAKLKLFHLDGSGSFGVIKLDANGNHLFLFDPIALDDVELLVEGKPLKESHLLKVRTYGATVIQEGKDATEIENREIVATTTIGAMIRLDDKSHFCLSCSVARYHEKGGFRLEITRNDDGEWRAKATPTDQKEDAPPEKRDQKEMQHSGNQGAQHTPSSGMSDAGPISRGFNLTYRTPAHPNY